MFFANSTIYLIEKRDNLGLIMPWRVQTEDCDELINEYLKEVILIPRIKNCVE